VRTRGAAAEAGRLLREAGRGAGRAPRAPAEPLDRDEPVHRVPEALPRLERPLDGVALGGVLVDVLLEHLLAVGRRALLQRGADLDGLLPRLVCQPELALHMDMDTGRIERPHAIEGEIPCARARSHEVE
jgi:hypothetical protein